LVEENELLSQEYEEHKNNAEELIERLK